MGRHELVSINKVELQLQIPLKKKEKKELQLQIVGNRNHDIVQGKISYLFS